MRLWLACVVGASATACGSTARTSAPSPAVAAGTKPAGATELAALRARFEAFCGSPMTLEGTRLSCVTPGTSLQIDVDGAAWKQVSIQLSGPPEDIADVHATAVQLASDVLNPAQQASTAVALQRLFQTSGMDGYQGALGSRRVGAATFLDPRQPAQRKVALVIEPRPLAGEAALAMTSDVDRFPSPTAPVSTAWVARAKETCTELVAFTSKTHKVPATEPVWTQDDVHVACKHPNDNVVAQFIITWAPQTRKLLYARVQAEVASAKFTGYVDKLVGALVSPAQGAVAKQAAKKAPTDRKYEADGLQIDSKHETGGFFGETHELEVSVLPGYTRAP